MNRSQQKAKQLATMQQIAAKATLTGLGSGRLRYPVKKPAKFIVTLRPVNKDFISDPYKSVSMCSKGVGSCECNIAKKRNSSKQSNKLSVPSSEKTKSLRDKSLTATSLLSGSKFITVDPNYKGVFHVPLTYSFSKMRLIAGNDAKQKKLNVVELTAPQNLASRTPAAISKGTEGAAPEGKKRFSFFRTKSPKLKRRKDKPRDLGEGTSPLLVAKPHLVEVTKPRNLKTDSGLMSGLTSESQMSRGIHMSRFPFQETSQMSSEPLQAQHSSRVKQLELQVQSMRNELNRIAENVAPHNEATRCAALTDKLNELNGLLSEMREQLHRSQPEDAQGAYIVPNGPVPQTTVAAVQVDPPATKLRTLGTQADTREMLNCCVQMDGSSETFLNAMGCSCTSDKMRTASSMNAHPCDCHEGQSKPDPIKALKNDMPPPPLPVNVAKKILEPKILEESSYCLFCEHAEIPTVTTNLFGEILSLIENQNPNDIALTILLQPNNLYHINVAMMQSGESLGCLYSTEGGIQEANEEHLFEEFLTFFIVDARNTVDQKNRILDHTFEFIRN